LFGDFVGTSELSDFPRPFIIGVCLSASRYGLQDSPLQTNVGSPGSRAEWFHACLGSPTARGPGAPCDSGALGVAFRLFRERRHPEGLAAYAARSCFRGSIPSLHVPLSTLRRRPFGRLRMTRGRRGSLYLQRVRLSLIPPCRFCRRTENA